MTLLVVGVNHRSTPVDVLERVVVADDAATKLAADVAHSEYVAESALLSTCNRVEVYADVTRFHAAVGAVTDLLARSSGVPLDELSRYLYVHYQERAVHHLFTVACGLDSVAVGEQQILGQVRGALRAAEEAGTVGRALGEAFRRALHAGKRARTETDIDAAGSSLVQLALAAVERDAGSLSGMRVLVVGAGAMAALTVATLAAYGVTGVTVANRTKERAGRLADQYGGRAVGMGEVPAALRAADLVITCTGAVGSVLTVDDVALAAAARPLRLVDLALPRDVDPAVGALPNVTLLGLEDLTSTAGEPVDLDAARAVVSEEVAAFGEAVEQAQVAPVVVALRGAAQRVVVQEMDRLRARVPELDERSQREVARAVHRIVEKLLHTPTVRVKQLSTGPGAASYADALRELFDLDPAAPEAVARVDLGEAEPGGSEGAAS